MSSEVNSIAAGLEEYPMEALAQIKRNLQKTGQRIFDFGTGDPRIPIWPKLNEALVESLTPISQYPLARGIPDLLDSQRGYLKRNFKIDQLDKVSICHSAGSKEAIFHIALTLCGRKGKRTLAFPNPGYPVYKTSALFSHSKVCTLNLNESNNYAITPWELPENVQSDIYALWVNSPHNPTGEVYPRADMERLVEWAHSRDVVLLSDECYVDIYDPSLVGTLNRPYSFLEISTDRVVSFFSLSKRSGLTGFRSGFFAGDAKIIEPIMRARANFGVGSPTFVQKAAIVGWDDDVHVHERRKIFSNRLDLMAPSLIQAGLLLKRPQATFYIWAQTPASQRDDVQFCLKLAENGLIATPSSWLSDGIKGYFRLAMVPEDRDTVDAVQILSRAIGR